MKPEHSVFKRITFPIVVVYLAPVYGIFYWTYSYLRMMEMTEFYSSNFAALASATLLATHFASACTCVVLLGRLIVKKRQWFSFHWFVLGYNAVVFAIMGKSLSMGSSGLGGAVFALVMMFFVGIILAGFAVIAIVYYMLRFLIRMWRSRRSSVHSKSGSVAK